MQYKFSATILTIGIYIYIMILKFFDLLEDGNERLYRHKGIR